MSEGGTVQADVLADWIQNRTPSSMGESTHGYKALEMIHAVHESASLHELVESPFRTRSSALDIMIESGHLPVRFPDRDDIRASSLREENMFSDENNE